MNQMNVKEINVKDVILKDVKIKESVRRLDDYRVTQDRDCVKLNQNESPFDFPEDLKRQINEGMLKANWNRYPDNFAVELCDTLAEYTNFPAEGIMVGNSSNELIQAAIHALNDSGDDIVISVPGYAVYKRLANVMNINAIEVPTLNDFKVDVNGIIKAAKNASMVLLASPDNPTGSALTLNEIAHIAQNIKGLLLLDEAYYEFNGETGQPLINDFHNIIIVRTFSKAFNLASIRLGYMIGNSNTINNIRKAKIPFSVGLFQQIAGITALKNPGFLQENVNKIITERERMMTELNKCPYIKTYPASANFILFKCLNKPAKVVQQKLHEKKVLLRHYETPHLNDYLRLTIGTKKENELFHNALTYVFTERVAPAH